MKIFFMRQVRGAYIHRNVQLRTFFSLFSLSDLIFIKKLTEFWTQYEIFSSYLKIEHKVTLLRPYDYLLWDKISLLFDTCDG